MNSYGAADFETLVGERFGVDGHEGIELTLTQVFRRDQPGQEMFSVIFRGPASAQFEQSIFSLTNPKAAGELFLVPIGRVGDEIEYEAAFNRLIEK